MQGMNNGTGDGNTFHWLREFRERIFPARGGSDSGINFMAAGLSVVVAFVLWLTISMRGTYTISVTMPLEVLALPEGEALAAPPPERARVQVTGEGWELFGLRRSPPAVPLFVEGPEVDVLGAVGEAGLPAGVSVQSAQPRTVQLSLDDEVERVMPIRLVSDFHLPAPYDLLVPPELTPDSVRVTGAQSVLRHLTTWPTYPLKREEVRSSFTTSVPLSDTLGRLVQRSVRTTEVVIRIEEYTEAQRPLPVRVRGLPPGVEGVRLVPDRVSATYRVPTSGPAFDEAQTSDEFYAVVRYDDIVRDTTSGTVPVTVYTPSRLDVRSVRLSPSQVEYFIRR